MKNNFTGWYFKLQNATDTIAVIPGFSKDHIFIQVITDEDSYMYHYDSMQFKKHTLYIGKCIFSKKGIVLHLPNLHGTISFGSFQRLSSDIMGPFRFFPMECRHSIISMSHPLSGTIIQDGRPLCFDQGKGYIEGDCGTSFPKSYLWLQCNDFDIPCSVMLSIASIPFYGFNFTGCICAINCRGKEYRLATYHGVRILAASSNHICLLQNKCLLEIDILSIGNSHPLRSPKSGKMVNTISESCNASIRIRLWENSRNVIDLESKRASLEVVDYCSKNTL